MAQTSVSEYETTVAHSLKACINSAESPFEVMIEIAPRISFATHQCDIPVLAALTARNNTDAPAEGMTVRLMAEPAVFAPQSWTIDRIEAGTETRIRADRRVSLAGGLLDGLTERMRADVVVELLRGDEVLAREELVIYALARNEWGGAAAMPELLAAFVMPNDPAIARLLKDASPGAGSPRRIYSGTLPAAIRARAPVGTARGSLGGGRSTAAELCRAACCFEARWPGKSGRRPDIEAHGLATCLDTTPCCFAAAPEQMGLNPVVVLTRGHAFVGAWLQPQTFSTPTVDDATELRKAFDQQ